MLAEVTLRPQLTADEIEGARQAVAFELETLSMRPEQETILMDMIHAVCLHMWYYICTLLGPLCH